MVLFAQSTGDTLPPRLPTATFAPLLPTITSSPTTTPQPSSQASATVTPTDIPMPPPEPTSVTRWLGVVADRAVVTDGGSAITVNVAGLNNLPVRLRPLDENTGERSCITGQERVGNEGCIFENLKPGQYLIAPEALGTNLPINLAYRESVSALFDLNVLPPGITGWQARFERNSNQAQATPHQESVVIAKVEGHPGQIVALHSARGTEAFCEVERSGPDDLLCEFAGLQAGVYLVEAVSTGASRRFFVDGTGQAEIIFSPNATYASDVLAQSPPIVGHGAHPRQPAPAATLSLAAVAQATPPAPLPTSTATPTPTRSPTPIRNFAWQGRVIEQGERSTGAIEVRAAGLASHPVVLRSGGWQSPPQSTNSQPASETSETKFGDLGPGDYVVVLVGLADLKVTLGPDQFKVIEFRYDFIDPPKN